MALTSRDETDLLLPLLEGATQTPPFATFLERVRRRTRAATVNLTMRTGHNHEPVSLFVGPDIHSLADELKLEELNLTDRVQYDGLRPGRVYSGDEFDDHDPMRKARRARDMRKLGLADERVVRVVAADSISAWLIIASAAPCTAADSALLSNLAPYVAAAVRAFVADQRRQLAERMNDETLQRSGSSWIVFDKSARVLALAPVTARMLGVAFGHALQLGQRPRELGPTIERALSEAAATFASDPGADQRTLVLSTAPHIEAILAPAHEGTGTLIDAPAMIAYCRQPRASSRARAGHFARLFDLPRREAELAILLADGHSLAETAEVMGLTIETTRNYSKRLFAKAGVRGQAELVRAVYESCAVLAQDPSLTN
jgi:DNA-binding CsgD family transcriptional regulator